MVPPNHPFNMVFHYKPFWGTPIFGNIHIPPAKKYVYSISWLYIYKQHPYIHLNHSRSPKNPWVCWLFLGLFSICDMCVNPKIGGVLNPPKSSHFLKRGLEPLFSLNPFWGVLFSRYCWVDTHMVVIHKCLIFIRSKFLGRHNIQTSPMGSRHGWSNLPGRESGSFQVLATQGFLEGNFRWEKKSSIHLP